MTRLQWLLRTYIVASALGLCFASVAQANPIAGGSLAFANGATLTGDFVYDPSLFDPTKTFNQPFTSWDLTTTAYGTTHHYLSTDTADGASAGVISNSNGDTVLSFFQVFPNGSVSNTFELDIVLGCGGTPNCYQFAALNTAFSLVAGSNTGITTCPPGNKCVQSGEQTPNALMPNQYLTGGVLNVSDPPGTFAFNVDSTIASGYTLYTGGTPTGGGGGTTTVPEPSSITLLGMSLVGLVAGRRRLA